MKSGEAPQLAEARFPATQPDRDDFAGIIVINGKGKADLIPIREKNKRVFEWAVVLDMPRLLLTSICAIFSF